MYELIGAVVGFGVILLIASIGLWKTGQLRSLFDKMPALDKQVEKLADAYDKTYPKLVAELAELQKKLDELLAKLPK